MSVSSTFRAVGQYPFNSDSGAYGFSLTAVDQTLLSLPAGAYQFYNDSEYVAVLRLGAAITSSKSATRQAGQTILPPGGACNAVITTATELHALLRGGAAGNLDVLSLTTET